jgi:hypothetical protein
MFNSISGQMNRRWEQVHMQNPGGWEDARNRKHSTDLIYTTWLRSQAVKSL